MQVISSKDNEFVKHVKKLKEKKYRDLNQEFIIEGIKLVKEAIEEKADIKHIVVCDNCEDSGVIPKNLMYEIAKYDCVYVTENILKTMSDVNAPQGILAIIGRNNQENKIDYNKKESEENYIFKVDLKNIDIKQIDLMKTVDKNTCLNKKIAPGTSGNFNILLDTNKDSKYKIYFQSVNEKPQNLYFKAIKDGKEIAKTQTLEELSEKLDGNIVKKEKIKINIQWYWNFENNKANSDIQDTEDSKKIKRYQFNLYALGEEI